MKLRPSLDVRGGSEYFGGPVRWEYRVAGIRVPRRVYRWLYRLLTP